MHWKDVVNTLNSCLAPYIPESGSEPKNGYAKGYITPDGRQLAVETNTEGERTNVWVEDVGPPPVPSHFQLYKEDKSRTSALSSVAPNLSGPGYGKTARRAYKIFVTSPAELTALLDWYSPTALVRSSDNRATLGETMVPNDSITAMPVNQILYGPPGTGKTYSTMRRAVEICLTDFPRNATDAEVKNRYEELRNDYRITFVTFHQSYGYEDFVEGLRPTLQSSGQISYSVVPGVFRRACDSARLPKLVTPGLSGVPLKDRTIYKMSLGASWNDEGVKVFKYCLENRCVLMGWGADVDFTDCKSAEEISERLKQEAPTIDKFKNQVAFVDRLKHELKVGDIVIVSHGNKAFRGIAEVTGEYEFDEEGPFHQSRPVKWLAVFEAGRPASEVNAKDFTMRSLHQLHDVNYDALEKLVTPATKSEDPQPHVLIIDEINRANISKVFGELITLLEPDKRAGKPNEITLKLAYSGEDFNVPANLFVLGTMNTADRSIAVLDTALRRRFEFEELQPNPDVLKDIEIEEGVDLSAMLSAINERVEYLYDRDHTIGHAYFIGVRSLADLERVFRRNVIPLLQEYFYEDWSKVILVLRDQPGRFIERSDSVPDGLQHADLGSDVRTRYKVRIDAFQLEAFLAIYQ